MVAPTPRYDLPHMTTPEDIERLLSEHRVRLVPKAGSRLMRLCGVLVRVVGNTRFLDDYFTTIGRTIYYPTEVTDPRDHLAVLAHELVHVRQWERWRVLFSVSYLLLPVPVLLAWCRWRWEREAYLIQLREAEDPDAAIAWAVERLWSDYAWPWPRRWMRRWFHRALAVPDRPS